MPENALPANRLLAALGHKEFKLILPKLERIELTINERIYEPGEPIRHVYFPLSGIISLLSAVNGHSTIEVGIVGDEGMAGLPIFLGVRTSMIAAVVQGGGFAFKISSSEFARVSNSSPKFRRILLRYMHAQLTQISQSAACNRFHRVEERLARWLLMTRDRMHADEFRITQEFLSNMLGVRREAVNKSAGILQKAGLISFSRGIVTILDRRALQKTACACYEIIKRESELGN